ncbi:MAG: phosphoribosylformylglycinamidine synthase subunit PurL [Actinomycetota bacterium]
MKTRSDLHRRLGLTDDEYSRIEEMLGRSPNRAELAMYEVMWSEHCSYKSSRVHLSRLPTSGPRVLMGPGEGAGVVEVGGVAVALRIESHNHPSFVEPVQGAATGVGGIVRDVLSVGARPVALLDSLRFGPLPSEGVAGSEVAARNRNLFEGVVSGVSSYGNCIGVPTIGGEVKFEDGYSGNPLVNVMCVGVAPASRIRRARAEGVGNAVILLGASTGRDGIGGVSVLASAAFGDDDQDKRPSVQVGDPFTEKLLIEACLELMDAGLVVGVQDLGGAGICCATSETAARAGTGMRIDLDRVPRREPGMEPFEVLTSESQERMLVVVPPAKVAEALRVCERWGLDASVIGEVTATGRLEVFEADEPVADVPASSLGDGPVYDRPQERPRWLDALASEAVDASPPDLREAFLKIVGSPNVSSKRWVWQQYDHQVMLGTLVGPGRDAAVLRVPGTKERIAVTTDGNGRYCHLDPRLGAAHAVAEAFRNLSAVGAEPIAVTNCLNLGSPERPEVMWQFAQVVDGIAEACEALGTPVTGGNVSFYNETGGAAIYPTPVVGMIGVIPPEVKPPPLGFRHEGDVVLAVGENLDELGGSEYARTVLGKVAGRIPTLSLETEIANSDVVRRAVSAGLLTSCHDLSDGGLAVAIAEACLEGGMGASVQVPENAEPHRWLFSETASRYLVSLPPGRLPELEVLAEDRGVPLTRLGEVGGVDLEFQGLFHVPMKEMEKLYEESLPAAMGYVG